MAKVSSHELAPRNRGAKRAAAAAVLLTLAGCTSETPGSSASNTPAASSPPAPYTTTATRAECVLPGASDRAVTKRVLNGAVTLSSLIGTEPRLAMHTNNGDCYERVVFPFSGSGEWPGVDAHYFSEPTQANPSDKTTVHVAGKVFLAVTMGAWTYAQGGGGAGPSHIEGPSNGPIAELALNQNSEGVTTWIIDVDEVRKFMVSDVAGTPGCSTSCEVVDIQTTG